MWFDESVIYQIYPLGYCGAERENNLDKAVLRFDKVEENIPHLKEMGITAVLFNPIFESGTHGYDTVDFFSVDKRLGTNADFARLSKKLHENGIRIILDGVFNHVGRKFLPFQDVQKNKWNSKYADWFKINFDGNSCYNDGFWYEGWEGHYELVKLNLENPEVQNYLLDAIRFWVKEFDIDGLRLDVCYLLPPWFMEILRRETNAIKSEFFLMGEVIHFNNFAQNICENRLNSATNYECFKGIISAFNSDNLFEIEHSLSRLFSNVQWAMFPGKRLVNFVDNHDVVRAYTALKDKNNILNLYSLLFMMPGMPCIYYGSEYLAEGNKGNNDADLRPYIDDIDKTKGKELIERIALLSKIKRENKELCYGSYGKVVLNNKYMAIARELDGSKIIFALNIMNDECSMNLGGGNAIDLLTDTPVTLGCVTLPAYSAMVLKLV